MKIRFTLLWFLCCVWCVKDVQGQTNVYHPLPDSGYYWNVIDLAVESETGSADTTQAIFNYYTIQGDTSVGGFLYLKVYKTTFDREILFLAGYFREDSANRKVYMVTDDPFEHTITNDTLLYDFNVEVGTDVSAFYEFRAFLEEHPSNATVTNVDSIEIEGIYRRIITIQFEVFQYDNKIPIKIDTLFWIEGIGSTVGFTLPIDFPLNVSGEYCADVLSCVIKEDSPIFTNFHSWHNCDSVFKDYAPGFEEILDNISVSIYPNPANEYFNIVITGSNDNIEIKAGVYDITGKEVYEKIENNKQFVVETTRINAGMYFLKISINNSYYYTSPIIISH